MVNCTKCDKVLGGTKYARDGKWYCHDCAVDTIIDKALDTTEETKYECQDIYDCPYLKGDKDGC